MRVFQEEIFGPVLARDDVQATRPRRSRSPTTRSTASVPASGPATATGRSGWAAGIKAGRVWTNCYHLYPAHAAFGGYKSVGRRAREPQDDARPLHARPSACSSATTPKPLGLLLSRWPGRVDRDAGGARGDRAPHGQARTARLLPVGRLLRRQRADVPDATASCLPGPTTSCWATVAAPRSTSTRACTSAGGGRGS